MEFKVGDVLKLTGVDWGDWKDTYHTVGSVTTGGRFKEVTFSPSEDPPYGSQDEIWTLPDEGWEVEHVFPLSRIGRVSEGNEPNVPYYQFPGGIEVRQISAHLMSFPSQIMQYASRSGRVDGNCKSEDVADKIRDFEKIIDFAKWEIERLEGEAPSQR